MSAGDFGSAATDRGLAYGSSTGEFGVYIRDLRVYSDSEWNVMERRGTGTMSISVLGERLDSNVR